MRVETALGFLACLAEGSGAFLPSFFFYDGAEKERGPGRGSSQGPASASGDEKSHGGFKLARYSTQAAFVEIFDAPVSFRSTCANFTATSTRSFSSSEL
jgi:hypothetical protein